MRTGTVGRVMAWVVRPVLCVLLLPSLAGAQSAAGRTPWRDPDLQGAWTNTTSTPLQRPFHR